MILASVSNTGGIALSMATLAALGERDSLPKLPREYSRLVSGLTETRSFDRWRQQGECVFPSTVVRWATKTMLLTNWETAEATHADMMRAMVGQFN